MASEAARQKYPEFARWIQDCPENGVSHDCEHEFVTGMPVQELDAILRAREVAARVDALREAADRAQQAFIDEQAGVGFARVSTEWLRAEADRIEKEARG